MQQVSHRRAWLVTALLFFFMFINFADKAVIGLAAVPMMRDLSLSPAEWGTVGSSFFLLFPLTALAGGFAVNRVPTRWALAAMGLIWAATQFPMLGTASFAVLIACRMALGAGEGPAYPVALHAAYKWFPDRARTLPTSIIAVGSAVGVFTAAPVLVWLIEAHGWRAAFALLGVVGLVWVAAWLAGGKEGPLADRPADETAGAEARLPYAVLLGSRTVVGVLVTGFAVYWALALLVAWLPAFLQQGLGYGIAASTALITLVWVAVAVLMPLIGWLAQRARGAGASSRVARGVPAGILVLAAGSLLVVALLLPAGGAQLGAMVFAYSLGGAIFTLGPAMVAEIAPAAQRGALLGIVTAVETVAGMIAPSVTGRIIAAGASLHSGYVAAFMLSGVIVVLGGVAGLVLLNPETDLARFAARGLGRDAAETAA